MKHGKPQILSQINIKQHIQKETAQSQYPMPEKVRFNLQPVFSHSLGRLQTVMDFAVAASGAAEGFLNLLVRFGRQFIVLKAGLVIKRTG